MEVGTPAVCGVDVRKPAVPEHNEL
jgi:hypothetical protein